MHRLRSFGPSATWDMNKESRATFIPTEVNHIIFVVPVEFDLDLVP